MNEGAVEWPCSPWRLLRALIATWHLKAREEVSESTLRGLITALAAARAEFQLPPATVAHTRHFMPLDTGKRTKVFDTFVHIAPKEEVLVQWDAQLTPESQEALRILVHRLGYLGRAEGLVEGRVAAMHESFTANAVPLSDEEPIPEGQEIVRVLVARRRGCVCTLAHRLCRTGTSRFRSKANRGSEEEAP